MAFNMLLKDNLTIRNKKKLTGAGLVLAVVLFSGNIVMAQEKAKPEDTEVWKPVPQKVSPATGNHAPSDAVVLFDGNSLEKWESANGGKAEWTVKDNILTVTPGTGDIRTKQNFTNFQLHVEWRSPAEIRGEGQGRGNSGIFLQGRYEVQVLDSYNNRTYSNGQAGSIYKQAVPLVNPVLPPGEWQTYDIIYTAPRFKEDGSTESKALVTVLLNGVLVQHNFEIQGPTVYIGTPEYEAHGPGPIQLQDHGDLVSFRNIWIREI